MEVRHQFTLRVGPDHACSSSDTTPAGVRPWTYSYCDAASVARMQRSGIREVFARKTRIPPLRDSIRATCYTYDAAGNRVTQTDARGVVSTYSYDALNRLTAIGYPTSTLDVHYYYYYYYEPNSTTG